MKTVWTVYRAFAPHDWDYQLPSVKLFELDLDRSIKLGSISTKHKFKQGRMTIMINLDEEMQIIFKPRVLKHWYIPVAGKKYNKMRNWV